MGFFAVAHAHRGDAYNERTGEDFVVEKLDINIWCLPGLLGRFIILCDVGMRIRAVTGTSQVDVAIPFPTLPGNLIDLHERLGDPATASLVFGEPVTDNSNGSLEPTSDYALLAPISVDLSRLIDKLSSDSFSLWRVCFVDQLEPGEERYFRFRVRPTNFGRVFSWRRTFFRRVGALADIHVCDPREAALVPAGRRYDQAMVKVQDVGVYVVVIASMRTRKASPELLYQRILEGRKWERYLERATDLRRRERFVIHCWRDRRNTPSTEKFRAFLELGRRTEALGWSSILAVSVLTTTLVVLSDSEGRWSQSELGRFVSGLVNRAADLVASQLGLIVGLGIAAIFVLVADVVTYAHPFRNWIVKRCRQFEDFIYRKRASL
jgi:hypothetical protein